MRYRPLGPEGGAISAVCLALGAGAADPRRPHTAEDWRNLSFAALEAGINAFEIVGRDPAILEGVAAMLAVVERRLVNLALRIGPVRNGAGVTRDFSPMAMRRVGEAVTARLGCGWLDLAVLDDPTSVELDGAGLAALRDLQSRGRVRRLALAGEDEAIDAYLTSGAFSVLYSPYSLTSGARERTRLKLAVERDVAVVATRYDPDQLEFELAEPERRGLFGLGQPRREALHGAGTYAFLERTPGWTREELCLGYALSEPRLASVQLCVSCPDQLAALATVPDRELPVGVAAQIEMARFSQRAA